MKKLIAAFLLIVTLISFKVEANPEKLKALLDEKSVGMTEHSGYSLYVAGPNGSFGVYKGMELEDDSIFRLASVTKTYVAATALRLMEAGKLKLETPIGELIDPAFSDILKAEGYDVSLITVRHLLSHTAGLADHTQTPQFFGTIQTTPQKQWTRPEQINALAEWTDPTGKPGEKFVYSDSGYVLLGHIIERIAGAPLPVVVRTLLGFNERGLRHTAWELGDNVEAEGKRTAQYIQGQNTFDWNGSLDTYGGGGLLSNPREMALFFKALFGGEVFENPETLKLMLSDAGLPADSPYRMGVFKSHLGGSLLYEHSGFWGIWAVYNPATGVAAAGAVTRQEDFPKLRKMIIDYLTQ